MLGASRRELRSGVRELGWWVREIRSWMHASGEISTAKDSDGALIAGSLRDPNQFTAIFDRYYDLIRDYLDRRVGRRLAEELASETFLRAFASRGRYDSDRPDARPWLYGIATNLVRRHVRSEERRRRAYARALESEEGEGGIDGLDARADAVAQRPVLAAALSRLTAADRDTLLLLALTDLDYEGIAIATDVPVGTVRSRLHRARRHLRAELAKAPNSNARGDRTTGRSRQ